MGYEVLASSFFTGLFFWISFQNEKEIDPKFKKLFFILGLLQIMITYAFMLIGANIRFIAILVTLHGVLNAIIFGLNLLFLLKEKIDRVRGASNE